MPTSSEYLLVKYLNVPQIQQNTPVKAPSSVDSHYAILEFGALVGERDTRQIPSLSQRTRGQV